MHCLILLLLMVASKVCPSGTACESVALIELNHHHDARGCLVYDQVIFYERAPDTGRFRVRAWCLVDDRETLNRRPVKNEETGVYQVDWYDSDKKLRRMVRSRLFRESWTQVDPERDNKKFHDERLRVGLISRIQEVTE
jgi:hypothetical protein